MKNKQINLKSDQKTYNFLIKDPKIDEQLKSLINDMLQFNECLRPSFEELYESRYFEDKNEEI